MKKEYKIKAKVWQWHANTGSSGSWYFVSVDKKISADIRKVHPKGFVKIRAQIGNTAWDTLLFPHKQSASYLLSVKATVRKKEGTFDGDEVKVGFKII